MFADVAVFLAHAVFLNVAYYFFP
uniref:Uncharacterized protein n=1 Tax=Anguilla anguilla TaxID=7936 RepID=A0A0E9VTA8_ANGAN